MSDNLKLSITLKNCNNRWAIMSNRQFITSVMLNCNKFRYPMKIILRRSQLLLFWKAQKLRYAFPNNIIISIIRLKLCWQTPKKVLMDNPTRATLLHHHWHSLVWVQTNPTHMCHQFLVHLRCMQPRMKKKLQFLPTV